MTAVGVPEHETGCFSIDEISVMSATELTLKVVVVVQPCASVAVRASSTSASPATSVKTVGPGPTREFRRVSVVAGGE